MDETEYLLQLRAHSRRRAQELERARLRAGEELAERHPFAVRAHGRVRRLEQINQQTNHLLRRVALSLRDATLLVQHARLPRRDQAKRREADNHDGRRSDGKGVAADELRQAVPRAVGPREHRPTIQVALEIVTERIHRRITIARLLLERLQHNGVEIATQHLAQRPFGRSRAWRIGILFEHGGFNRPDRIASKLVRPRPHSSS